MRTQGIGRWTKWMGAALCAASLLAASPAALAQGKPEKAKVTIAVGGKALFYYLPLTIAERLGYFKDEGPTSRSSTSPVAPRPCRPWWAAARMW